MPGGQGSGAPDLIIKFSSGFHTWISQAPLNAFFGTFENTFLDPGSVVEVTKIYIAAPYRRIWLIHKGSGVLSVGEVLSVRGSYLSKDFLGFLAPVNCFWRQEIHKKSAFDFEKNKSRT